MLLLLFICLLLLFVHSDGEHDLFIPMAPSTVPARHQHSPKPHKKHSKSKARKEPEGGDSPDKADKERLATPGDKDTTESVDVPTRDTDRETTLADTSSSINKDGSSTADTVEESEPSQSSSVVNSDSVQDEEDHL